MLIIETLRELMQTMAYDDITVSDIVQNAGISRSTFYRHFLDKQHVLESVFEQEVMLSNIFDFTRSICERETDMLSIMMKHPQFWIYMHENPAIRDLWQSKAYKGTLEYLQHNYSHVPELDFFCRILGVGFIDLNREVLKGNFKITPEELGSRFQAIIDMFCCHQNQILHMTFSSPDSNNAGLP